MCTKSELADLREEVTPRKFPHYCYGCSKGRWYEKSKSVRGITIENVEAFVVQKRSISQGQRRNSDRCVVLNQRFQP